MSASRPAAPFAVALLAAAALCATAPGASAQTAAIAQGPTIQAVTAGSASIWVRTTAATTVRARVRPSNSSTWTTLDPVLTDAASDFTARLPVPGLSGRKTWIYQVGVTSDGVETWSGNYRFDTPSAAPTSFSMAVVSDFHTRLQKAPALRNALAARPQLLAVIGDLDHRNPADDPNGNPIPATDAAAVLDDMRHMHRDTRDPATPIGNDFWSGITGKANAKQSQVPMIYGWDDHDYCGNNEDMHCVFKPEAVQAYREYFIGAADNGIDGSTAATCATPADFQSLTYGKLLQVWLLDARSARDMANGTLLGPCQFDWLTQGLASSRATWKVVLSPVPLNGGTKTYDAWSYFAAERQRFLDFVAANGVRNVVFLTGDIHSGGAVDDGTHSGLPELNVPHANMPDNFINTYCRRDTVARAFYSYPGQWTIGQLTEPNFGTSPATCAGDTINSTWPLMMPPLAVYPLTGKGNAGFAWIDVTPTTFTASVRNVDGSPRSGVLADGTPALLQLQLTAQ